MTKTRRSAVVVIAGLLGIFALSTGITSADSITENATAVIHVNQTGWWSDPTKFNTSDNPLQDAINNISPKGTVIVHEGIYEEQLYIAKSLDLRAAEGESPEIHAPAPEELESYDFDIEWIPGKGLRPWRVTSIIMVNGSSGDVSVNISGFVIDGSSVTPENSEFGSNGIVYLRANGTIEDNEVKNFWGKVERVETPEGYRIVWNGFVIWVYSDTSNDITIRGNYVHNYTGVETTGIAVYGQGARATITKNTVTSVRSPDYPQGGINVAVFATATITDNILTGYIYCFKEEMPWATGITITDANTTIEGNTLLGGGIWLNSGFFSPHSVVSIKDNIVDASGVHETDCGPLVGIGLYLYESPSFYEGEPAITATIEGNQLIGASGIGVDSIGISIGDNPEHTLFGTVNATVIRNIVSGWERGIELFPSSNSVIYLNDFVNNTQNVLVNESTNVYHSPEKINYTYEGRDYTNYVGNYWSDYEGEDANADGIGDTPYGITGDNPDSYPLMAPNENYEQIGILVIAHGSPRESWCKPVKEAVESVSMRYPTEVGYLEFVGELEGYDFIHEAVDKLDEQGVTKIIAVPLFISSHSGHIAEIEYVLGLRETLPETAMKITGMKAEEEPGEKIVSRTWTFVDGVEMERSVISREGRYFISYKPISEGAGEGVRVMQHGIEEEELVPVDTSAEIVLTSAIDNHTLIAQILADRAAELCTDPPNETVVFVEHGSWTETYFAGWINSSESLAEKVKLILRHSKGINIKNVTYSFIAQPEDYPVNLTVRAVVEDVSATSYPVVVPLMVSEGFFTSVYIPRMLLAGLDYAYPERGKRALTPHPNVANWIEVTAAKELTYPTIPIYNDSQLLNISIEDVGAYHGDICICLALGFRGAQLAIADLCDVYEGEMPHQGDFRVISASPTKGIRDAFGYIMNATGDDYVLDLPPGTDKVNLTSDNFQATIIRKSTGDSVTIQVKEGIFPDRFFELRKKVKFGIPAPATPEEKKAFKLLWTEAREKALYKPMKRVFEKVTTFDFDTKAGAGPSIFGTHNGTITITPFHDVIVNMMYTYPCIGTGGHSEYVRIYNESGTIAEAHWDGYTGDYHNISFDTTFILEAGKRYNYTIRTGSYPQIHHTDALPTASGWINCTEFVDANGKSHDDWIPAIRLFYETKNR